MKETDRSAQTKPSRQKKTTEKRTTKVNDLRSSQKGNTTKIHHIRPVSVVAVNQPMGNPDGFPPMMIANCYRHRLSSRENASGCSRADIFFYTTRCRGLNSQSRLHSHHKPLSRSAQNISLGNPNLNATNVTKITKNLPPPEHSSYATVQASSSSSANSLVERN